VICMGKKVGWLWLGWVMIFGALPATIVVIALVRHFSAPSAPASAPGDKIIHAIFVSTTGDRLAADFDNTAHTVTVTYQDRTVTLPRAISASGARYTADDNEVLWNKGNTATYWRNTEIVFEGVEEVAATAHDQ